MPRVPIVLAIACGLAAACVLSIDPLPTAPAVDGGAPEASVAPSDAAATDASDAALDATRFCASFDAQPLFCDDFDEDQSTMGWTETLVYDGGTLALDDASFVSAPSALLARMNAQTDCSYARYKRNLPGAYANRAKLAFDVRPGRVGATGGFDANISVNAISLAGPGGAGSCAYSFAMSPAEVNLIIERSGSASLQLSKLVTAGKWTHVELVVSTTGAIDVFFDGTNVGSATAPSGCQHGLVDDLIAGFDCVNTGSDNEFRIDNLVVTTE